MTHGYNINMNESLHVLYVRKLNTHEHLLKLNSHVFEHTLSFNNLHYIKSL